MSWVCLSVRLRGPSQLVELPFRGGEFDRDRGTGREPTGPLHKLTGPLRKLTGPLRVMTAVLGGVAVGGNGNSCQGRCQSYIRSRNIGGGGFLGVTTLPAGLGYCSCGENGGSLAVYYLP